MTATKHRLSGREVALLGKLLVDQGLAAAGSLLRASLISGGRSNLTYDVVVDDKHWVLRRPPYGPLLATAHDVGREYRVLCALVGTDVPAPAPIFMHHDSEPLGAPFYLVEHEHGVVLRDNNAATSTLSPVMRRSVAFDLIDVLARLHRLDPHQVGLGDFGRPDGYLARQVDRWRRQLAASRTRALRGADELAAALAGTVPESGRACLVHGDYRLDNVLVDPARGRITAVLDWELATLGDPRADLALFFVYYEGMVGLPGGVVESPAAVTGFPPASELVDRYVASVGGERPNLAWPTALAWFKLAAILEGVHYRDVNGQTRGEGFTGVAELVQPCLDRGLEALAGGATW